MPVALVAGGSLAALSLAVSAGAAAHRAAPLRAAPVSPRAALVDCLRAHRATVLPAPRTTPALRSLSDLSRHSSIVVRTGRAKTFVALAPSVANAEVLVELLAQPRSHYVLRRSANVVQLSARGSNAARVVASCARATVAEPARRASQSPRQLAGVAASTPISTVAGNGVSGNAGDAGPAIDAQIDAPRSVAALPDGSLLVVEPFQNDVRRVWPDGTITRFAGIGSQGYTGDGGQATLARLSVPHAVSVLPSGAVLIADRSNNRIREVALDGTITTVAGDGVGGYAGDNGPATQAEINAPAGVAALDDGGFLIADTNNHRVRLVSAAGTITTVAGDGAQGYSGDGGAATAASVNSPFGVSPLPGGAFLVDDVGNQRIREVAADGTITTVAGNGTAGYTGDGGPATSAELDNPHNVWATRDGGFLIADTSNSAIRKVDPDGTITTIAGNGTPGSTGDGGPAADAELAFPKAVVELSSGAIAVADTSNNTIRWIGDVAAPTLLTAPTVLGLAVQGAVVHADSGRWSSLPPVSLAYQWQRCSADGTACADIAAATGASYTVTADDVGSTLRVTVTATNAGGATAKTSAQTSPVVDTLSAPVNTTAPTIVGTPVDGQTLRATDGSWTGTAPISYAYQWKRCDGAGNGCVDVAGATARTYVVSPADFGSTLRVQVTASSAAAEAAYESAVLADAPLAYWRFDDAAGRLVDQKGFADGAYMNRAAGGVAGLLSGSVDGAVGLDGTTQYVDVPANAAWTSSPFSIEILVEPSQSPVNRTIWSAIGSGFAGWWLNTGPAGQLRMFVGDGSTWRYDDPNYVLEAGNVYDIVASYDGTNLRLYVNGALISTGPAASMNGAVGKSPLRFGAYSTGPGQFWPGTLDDASFYTSSLSGSAVAAHYAASLSTAPLASSTATAEASAAPPRSLAPPVVSGFAGVGSTLTTSTGTWSGTAPLTFGYQWQRCDASGASCSAIPGATQSSYLYTTADDPGSVRVVVTAGNAAGAKSATSSPAPPNTTIASGPPATTTDTSASFSFVSNVAGSTFACSLDGSAFAACASPHAYAGLAAGAHVFEARATDAAGNTDSTPAVARWTVLSPPPPPPPPTGGTGSGGGGGGGGVPPDLSVALAANLASAPAPGGELIFFATVSTANAGSSSAAQLTLTLPAGYAVTRTYTDRGAGCTGGGAGVLTCDVAWISAGTSTKVTVWGTVGAAGEQTLSATATSLVEREAATTLANNTAVLKVAPTGVPFTPPAAVLSALKPPTLGGVPVVGRTLVAHAGVWSTRPAKTVYSWQVCGPTGCRPIAGASGTTLKLGKGLRGKRVRVVATASSGVTRIASASKQITIRAK